MDQSVTVKGPQFRSLQKFIDAELTPPQREALFTGLPPDFARLKSPVLATETIPIFMLNRLTEEAAKVKGESLDQFARRAGREAASDAVKGIYRFFAMILTPPALMGKASQMWSSLYNRGEMKITNQTDHGATIRIVDFPSEA